MKCKDIQVDILAIIPARGGSKGVPNKNLRRLNNKPLIAHSIGHALASSLVNRVVVSTDSEEIASTSKRLGAEVIVRPEEISGDTASSESALLHALDYLKQKENYRPDIVVFLQCTSPIRAADDIDKAIGKLTSGNADSLLSVAPSHRFLWTVDSGEAKPLNYDYMNRQRRQDMRPQYVENGSIYVSKTWVLEKTHNRLGGKVALHVMSDESAWEIDSLFDFSIVEQVMVSAGKEK